MELTRLMKIKDVAELTQLQPSTIRKYVLNETIPFIKLETAIRFDPASIKLWIDERAKASEKYRSVAHNVQL